MTSCCNQQHEDIISKQYFSGYTSSFYYEHKQKKIFLIFKQTLFIIDSTNFIKICPQCKKNRNVYIYGTCPDVCGASFDGKTDLPICAVVHGIKELKLHEILESEPSFGKFIYTLSKHQNKVHCTIIYYLNGNIEQSKNEGCREISVDGKPDIICQTVDEKCIIIISNGEILETETVYSIEPQYMVFKVGNGTLRYSNEHLEWSYTANPALRTKAAIHE
jgi:hypothetical protein